MPERRSDIDDKTCGHLLFIYFLCFRFNLLLYFLQKKYPFIIRFLLYSSSTVVAGVLKSAK